MNACSYKNVGIVGMPPLDIIAALNKNQTIIHDLDTRLVKADMESTAPFLPRVYCAILRTVVLNALYLELDAIYIDVGAGKCDSALHVATILENNLSIPVIRTRNSDRIDFGTTLCQSDLPLKDKFFRITESVKSATVIKKHSPCRPTAGFWGVPPRDFSILNLFPATTHIYGWTRCMENKTPSNGELELYYNPHVPTVFFAQSFCSKSALAYHLAKKHPRALYLDSDICAGSSAKAKIEAFLELSGAFK